MKRLLGILMLANVIVFGGLYIFGGVWVGWFATSVFFAGAALLYLGLKLL